MGVRRVMSGVRRADCGLLREKRRRRRVHIESGEWSVAYSECGVRGMWDLRCEGWGVWFGLDGPQKERDDACMASGLPMG